jgi:hypothetical protein
MASFQGGVTCTVNGQFWPMRSVRYGNWSGRNNLKAALKFLLQLGPVAAWSDPGSSPTPT